MVKSSVNTFSPILLFVDVAVVDFLKNPKDKEAQIDLIEPLIAQVAETAAKHFATESDLVLLALNADTLGDALRWEPSRGGALFPHLYRPLRLSDVIWDKSLPLGLSGHIFPEGVW